MDINFGCFLSRSNRFKEDFLTKEVVSPLLTFMCDGDVERLVAVVAAFSNLR